MSRYSAERVAQVGISVLFLALARTVGEYFRLRHALGPALGLAAFAPYVPGLGLGVLGTWAAVLLYFGRRFRAATGAAVLTVAPLLAYKLTAVP
jgi:hypothetical protein